MLWEAALSSRESRQASSYSAQASSYSASYSDSLVTRVEKLVVTLPDRVTASSSYFASSCSDSLVRRVSSEASSCIYSCQTRVSRRTQKPATAVAAVALATATITLPDSRVQFFYQSSGEQILETWQGRTTNSWIRGLSHRSAINRPKRARLQTRMSL